jgi:hypothetical protein
MKTLLSYALICSYKVALLKNKNLHARLSFLKATYKHVRHIILPLFFCTNGIYSTIIDV